MIVAGKGFHRSVRRQFLFGLWLLLPVSQSIPLFLNEFLSVLKFAIIFFLIDEPRLLVLIVLFFGEDDEGLDYFSHVLVVGFDQRQEYFLIFSLLNLSFEHHDWLQDKGIKMGSKVKMFLQWWVFNKIGIPQHFEQIIGLMLVEDNPFAIPPGVLADVVDGGFPVLD